MILVLRRFIPTDAEVIRAMAFAKGLSELGEDVKLCFLVHNPGQELPKIKGVRIFNLSDGYKIRSKAIQVIISLFELNRYAKNNEPIVLMSFMWQIFFVMSLFNAPIYHERTETGKISFLGKIGPFIEKIYVCRANNTNGIFVISNKLKDDLIRKGVETSKIHVLNMIVDGQRFAGLNKSTTKKDYIAYCGTVSNYKDGVNYLLEAMAYVHKIKPEVELHILGKCPFPDDVIENERIIRTRGIEDIVKMPGLIPYEEMPQKLLDASVLVLARPDNEQADYGFPTKLGEYLMSGNPVVVTRVGEIDSFLENNNSCLFAKPRDPVDIANKIIWCLQHHDESKVIGEKGKQVAESSFNYKGESKKLLDAIKSSL